MKKEDKPWKTLSKQTIYENPWIRIEHHEVINPSNKEGIYGLVHFKNVAVSVFPLDDDGNTYLVGQYRYTLDTYSWELPEGGCLIQENEIPLKAAKRELEEETGLKALEWHELGSCFLSNSVTDERAFMYLAKNLQQGAAAPEETESLVIKKLPVKQVFDMVDRGEIQDALSIITILKVKALIS
ncbi:NUDIX domain-containing protein [Aquirufa rosea]|uniref:GDP-mannose pyrophosphatase n=1 Tax=Aquirufa rosea TaxID=2509241 RepID=A0A4Q1C2G1_9BACT|nr:NUDIX hydrolase [Aquirufa rosea]RXK52357.1 NUDIX hydrolase [Aquirufa rosea]